MTPSIKGVSEVRVSRDLWSILDPLDGDHKYWRWIRSMKEALLYNRLCGEGISKKRIPDYYKEKHGVNNLYRYSHPEGFRSCYTLLDNKDGKIKAHILDLMSHPEYEEKFGYKI